MPRGAGGGGVGAIRRGTEHFSSSVVGDRASVGGSSWFPRGGALAEQIAPVFSPWSASEKGSAVVSDDSK